MATDVKPNAFARFGNDLHSGAARTPSWVSAACGWPWPRC